MQNGAKTSSTGQLQVCPLLSLPGELRNRIYDFCAEDGAVNLPASQTRFGNLRYVCQFLYIEFSPLYLARTAVVLQPTDVERYLAVFYPGLQSHKTNTPDAPTVPTRASLLPGRIRIDTPLGATLDLSSFADFRSSKLLFTLVRGNCTNRPLQEASGLLRTIVHSSYSTPFWQVIERILFRYSFTPEVVFKLRPGFIAPLSEPTTPHTYIVQTASWLAQLGLPHLLSLKIVLESSGEVLRAPKTNVAGNRQPWGHMQMHPLDELDGSDSRQNFLTVQLLDLNESKPSSEPGIARNPTVT